MPVETASEPAQVLKRAVGLESETRDAYRLADSTGLSGRIFWLLGLDQVPEETRARWLAFIRDYSGAAKNLEERRRSMFCACLTGTPALAPLSDDMLIANHWWWSSLSSADLLAIAPSSGTSNPITESLVDELVIELAGYDVELAERLVSRQAVDLPSLTTNLREHPERATMARTPLDRLLLSPGRPDSCAPALDPFGDAWSRGWCNLLRKGRLWIHPAWLLAHDHDDRVERLLWKAQAKALLPVIDEQRELVVCYMSRRHGDAWLNWEPRRFAAGPDDLVEIGYLKRLTDVDRRMRRESASLQSLIVWLHFARNRLAHLRCLSRGDFETGWKRIQGAAHLFQES